MKILDHLPIPDEPTSVRFGNRHIKLRRAQILVWVSIHLSGVLEPERTVPRFPALLDTGNNFGFSVQDRHLREWAGIDPRLLEHIGNMEINGQAVTCQEATVWPVYRPPPAPSASRHIVELSVANAKVHRPAQRFRWIAG